MKNFFGQDVMRIVFYLMMAGLLATANVGCDSLEDEDDGNSSAGSSGTATAVASDSTPATDTEAEEVSTSEATLSGTGIVWKPRSDSDGKLVILIPKSYSKVGVSVVSPEDSVIENGRYVGRTNGSRPTYRFSRPGRDYPDGSYLRVGSKKFLVPETSKRYN